MLLYRRDIDISDTGGCKMKSFTPDKKDLSELILRKYMLLDRPDNDFLNAQRCNMTSFTFVYACLALSRIAGSSPYFGSATG